MTLHPASRVLLTDSLRPPAGFRVDSAVATTYSLNLTALLLAPLSFALYDQSVENDAADPIRTLEAVRRHADHTTVFCQAGGIHVPSNYRTILTFVEDSVIEVTAGTEEAIFHPKIWAVRYVDEHAENYVHRLLVLSRNMTLDASWDTALVLDEAAGGAIPARPAADFVRRLPELSVRPLATERADQVHDLAATLGRVRFAPPAPFTEGRLVPIGLNGRRVWPFPEKGKRVLAISPFLTSAALASLGSVSTHRTLLSRADSLELVGASALKGWDVNVLQSLDVGDEQEEAVSENLHAKTYVVDLPGGRSDTVTGSANLTSSRWGRNVEFAAVLSGPTSECGVQSVLDALGRMIEQYALTGDGAVSEEQIESAYEIEGLHQRLALACPRLDITRVDEQAVDAVLRIDLPDDLPGVTLVWPVTLPGHDRILEGGLTWRMAAVNVTPFIAFQTTLGEGPSATTRSCVVKATLHGDLGDRKQHAMRSVLESRADVLRYLIFLLGDPAYDALFAELAGAVRRQEDDTPSASRTDIALLEPLVRAAGRSPDALARVASLVAELRAMPDGEDLVPEGFEQLWDVVWAAHSESGYDAFD